MRRSERYSHPYLFIHKTFRHFAPLFLPFVTSTNARFSFIHIHLGKQSSCFVYHSGSFQFQSIFYNAFADLYKFLHVPLRPVAPVADHNSFLPTGLLACSSLCTFSIAPDPHCPTNLLHNLFPPEKSTHSADGSTVRQVLLELSGKTESIGSYFIQNS